MPVKRQDSLEQTSFNERLEILNRIRNANGEESVGLFLSHKSDLDKDDLIALITDASSPDVKGLILKELVNKEGISNSEIYGIALSVQSIEVFTECIKLLLEKHENGEWVAGFLIDLKQSALFNHLNEEMKTKMIEILDTHANNQREQLEKVLDPE